MGSSKGIFITFEGPEGSGKTTQSKLLYKYLIEKGFNVIYTREPGGTELSESIRRILLNPHTAISPLTELLLYEACRAQHVSEIILPALRSDKIVICDRFTDATIAYQGYGRGISLNIINTLNRYTTFGIKPDLTILLDIPVNKGLKKARLTAKEIYYNNGDRLEREKITFHKRIREGYIRLAKKEPSRIIVVKNEKNIEITHNKIIKIVEDFLTNKKR